MLTCDASLALLCCHEKMLLIHVLLSHQIYFYPFHSISIYIIYIISCNILYNIYNIYNIYIYIYMYVYIYTYIYCAINSGMYMERTATSKNKFTQFYTYKIDVTDEKKQSKKLKMETFLI